MFQLGSGKEIQLSEGVLNREFQRALKKMGSYGSNDCVPLSGRECEQSHTSDTCGWCNQTRFQQERPCFGVEEIIIFLSLGTTLIQGTVIMTSTPSGVAMKMTSPLWLKHGQVVEVKIEHLGSVKNRVHFE